MTGTLLLILRALLLAASFTGLVAAVRSETGLDRFIAPFFTASGVIVVLMLAGMAHALKVAFYALYAAGFAGLAFAYGYRRRRPDLPVIALLAAFALFLVWRMYPAKLFSNDDLSHWGLVARHLLRTDAFPDASVGTVLFQSYPLGGAAFIYYFARTLESSEGVWLIAAEFLYGLAFLPVLSHARRNRTWAAPILAGMFLYFYGFMRQYGSLRVDGVLGFYGLGIAATALYYRDDWKKAALAVSLPILAAVYLKNSGLFFAFVGALLLGWCAARQTGKRRAGAVVFAATLGAAVCAYLLWTLHVRAAFPVGMETKHAVSLVNFSRHLKEKDPALIRTIVKKMGKRLLHPGVTVGLGLVFAALCAAFAGAVALLRPRLRAAALRALRVMLFAGAVYALWMGMLFLMYVFSMPRQEAQELASYGRYMGTAGILLAGMAGMALVDLVGKLRFRLKGARLIGLGAGAVGLILFVLLLARVHTEKLRTLLDNSAAYPREREIIRDAQEALGFPDGGSYLFFWQASDTERYSLHYFAKYEYDTMTISFIVHSEDPEPDYDITVARPGEDEGAGTGHEAVLHADRAHLSDPRAFLEAYIGAYDAVIVGDRDPLFEAELQEVLAGLEDPPPVYYAWEAN